MSCYPETSRIPARMVVAFTRYTPDLRSNNGCGISLFKNMIRVRHAIHR